MSALWLLLWLAGQVHLLALHGLGASPTAVLLALLPVLGLPIAPWLAGRPALATPWVLRAAGLAGLGGTLAFARLVSLSGWDVADLAPTLASTLGGLGSLLALQEGPDQAPGPGHWLWVGGWLGTGFLDPALPLVGAGLGGALAAFGALPGTRTEGPAPAPVGLPTFLLLGLALPKPWWDFGPRPEGALAGLTVGLGAALASAGPVRATLRRLPPWTPAAGLALLFVLYGPRFLAPWGAAVGVMAALAWDRAPRPFPLGRLGLACLAGLALSFTLHANLWIPGLRHLIWLGN